MISVNKWKQLRARMQRLQVEEADLQEKFIIGSGHGGQKLHKTASCVYLKHEKSGIEIKCQESRSRESNRFYARRRLCDKLEEQLFEKESKVQQQYEKIRRQKRRRSRRAQQKILKDKHAVSQTKALRKPPKTEE